MILNKKQLRAMGLSWLRYTKQCPVVCFERSVVDFWNPDIFGITKDRKTIEIEIKMSYSDFVKDRKKRVWWFRQDEKTDSFYSEKVTPHYFYFLTPPNLVEKIKKELPNKCGLLTYDNKRRNNSYTHLPYILVDTKVRCNPEAVKISIKDVIHVVKHQSGSLCSLAIELAKKDEEEESSSESS